ncbi:HIT family protein [Oryzomicrobium sp.]|uniref:HIT family protein n=1 Tax=Oryzomicrobium sp. TaxID=1911578 RepID=UPI0025D21ADC|nr:HIT family protein [Oryzomicrobium sp.]MCE1242296.1 HIT family protein [Oryzomicrobium sp.]
MAVPASPSACPLCATPGGQLLVESPEWRIIRAEEPDYPGFLRVIWSRHAGEMSDLDDGEQQRLMAAVLACERVLRRLYAPDKVNLASLGNMVPHLHWHIIPRWRDDPTFPGAIWAARRTDGVAPAPRPAVDDRTLAEALKAELEPAKA